MPLSARGRRMGVTGQSGGVPTGIFTKFKFKFLAVQGSGNIAIAEIELRETISGSDYSSSGTASASGDIGSSYAAGKAIDDNASTMWNSGTGGFTNLWWECAFASNKELAEYAFKARSDGYTGDNPTSWEVYGWDGSDYVLLKSQTTPGTWTAGEQRVFTI